MTIMIILLIRTHQMLLLMSLTARLTKTYSKVSLAYSLLAVYMTRMLYKLQALLAVYHVVLR